MENVASTQMHIEHSQRNKLKFDKIKKTLLPGNLNDLSETTQV
jgi:hypothetical protein